MKPAIWVLMIALAVPGILPAPNRRPFDHIGHVIVSLDPSAEAVVTAMNTCQTPAQFRVVGLIPGSGGPPVLDETGTLPAMRLVTFIKQPFAQIDALLLVGGLSCQGGDKGQPIFSATVRNRLSKVPLYVVEFREDNSDSALTAGVRNPGGIGLANPWEVHAELKTPPGTADAVKNYFPSFREYDDLLMYHPKFGYYATGRVNFSSDYQTFPIVLAPYFGRMVTEQVFRMWDGMRKAGTLAPDETFTIAEFGGGDGSLAESVLDYVEQRSKTDQKGRWREFAGQMVYAAYDRSPALSKAQLERNSRFGRRFEARVADAMNPAATIAPESLKGVVLSNELPSAFSPHKVILSPNGAAEVAFVVPTLSPAGWARIRKLAPEALARSVEKDSRAIAKKLDFPRDGAVYLSRTAFVALLESLAGAPDYVANVQAFAFHEIYVPAGTVPELSEHLSRYADHYRDALSKTGLSVVTYINLGVEKFNQGAAKILKAGYVLTVDYGDDWNGIVGQDPQLHLLRTYGPANGSAPLAPSLEDAFARVTYDPYTGPTLNDITIDTNFSLMQAEGEMAGLKTLFYGPQSALQSGTGISLETPPAGLLGDAQRSEQFRSWVSDFNANSHFRIMVQQKANTDVRYQYPDANSERYLLAREDRAVPPRSVSVNGRP